jgi:hypothetical protein
MFDERPEAMPEEVLHRLTHKEHGQPFQSACTNDRLHNAELCKR